MNARRKQRTTLNADADYTYGTSPLRVRDVPERLRPREEFARFGVENVSDDVLLAIILRSGVHGTNVIDLSKKVLSHYGSLTALAKSSVEELDRLRGMGKVKAQVLMAALELARRLSEENMPAKCYVRTPADVARLLKDRVRTLDEEVFWVLLLDAKNGLNGVPVEISRGLLDASLVHPREVFRKAIRSASAAIILAHNHPSGDPAPSAEDIRVTKQLVQAGRIVDIHVLDHVVIGKATANGSNDLVSMREAGIVNFGE